MTKKMLPLMLLTILVGSLVAMNEYKPVLCKNNQFLKNLKTAYTNTKCAYKDKTSETSWLNIYSWSGSIGSKTFTLAPFIGLGIWTLFAKKKPTARTLKITATSTVLGGLLWILNRAVQKRITKQKKELETDYQNEIGSYCTTLKKMIGSEKAQKDGTFEKTQLRDFNTKPFDSAKNVPISEELQLLQESIINLKTFPAFNDTLIPLNNFIERNEELIKTNESQMFKNQPVPPSTPDSFGDESMYESLQNYLQEKTVKK